VGQEAAVCIYIQVDPILAVSLSHPQSHETTLDHLSWEQDMPWSRDFGIESDSRIIESGELFGGNLGSGSPTARRS
jgi:hypothetical protein